MRHIFALIACSLAVTTAAAADPAPALGPAAPATASKAGEPSIKPALPSIRPGKPSRATAAALAAEEAEAEAELSAKIAARLAAMRANQKARAAAAAKARKAAEARKAAALVAAAEPAVKPYHGNHWSYEGETGPANWGRNPAWSKCGTGNRQSPIDLRDGMKVDLEQISFDYRPSSFNVVDNGHTIQVNVGHGNSISLQGRSYELQQFHFHRPSEERINGKGFEMVVHLEHKDVEGRLAVVSVMLERGRAQDMIQTVWNNLPLEKHDIVTPAIVLNPADVLPLRREYFTYMGSLTKPPCSEGVLWLVMKEPVQASPAQMALFARLYPLNARPIQAHSGRVVKESN
ncbi:carbonic anhydrase family protein [Massilia sp. PAMC28688]|uniref:carbonic anhydrase n=1 Tax=Massilia sp. PAMC28688 TaxID=2861283 RepID=UPI001C624A26|nr:carbonic anhydrase family protein [Massilia sp. PAMC28688]QYF91673.1 carbonic anhydrase family protein [Massilia sp. PAMC28688]